MPDDQGGQPQYPNVPGNESQPSQYLTDEVAPDISAQSAPPVFPEPQTPAPQTPSQNFPMPQPAPASISPQMPETIPTAPQPASAASYSKPKHFPLVTLLLMLIAIGAIAATYFFFLQTQSLNRQLVELSKTLENQKPLSPTPTVSETPISTLSGTPTPTATSSPSISPTPTKSSGITTSLSAFSQIDLVLAAAQKNYPNAQLIMITITDAQSESDIAIKYWFRQTQTTKKYLYVLRQPGKDLAVVDQQVYVTPDTDIPSLNQMALNTQLGIDLADAISLATTNCPTNYDCANSVITAQYIKANTTLWQLTLTAPGSTKPFIFQIDSITKKVLFKSS